jgi:pilus assembly protein FimV
MLRYLVLLRRFRGDVLPVVGTITAAILGAALALLAPIAHGAGLGKINVLSPLGQPLNAEIEIVALRPGEEDTLVARVAPLEAFTAAGIEPSHLLSAVRFAIERRGAQRILRMTTTQAVNEPFVELLIELQWNTGRLVREYTFLLDPPEYKAREAIAATPPKAPAKPMPVEPAKPAAPEPAKPPPVIESKPIEPAAPPVVVAPVIAAEPAKPEAEPMKPPAVVAEAKPEEAKPAAEEPKPAAEEPKPAVEAPKPAVETRPVPESRTHEVVKGDTLGAIAQANLPAGVSLNQMLLALYRANQDAFIRENVNLVRAGHILTIPSAEAIGTVDVEEANRVVREHHAQFREYRSRLAAVPAPADAAPGQREAAGAIEPKPETPKPAAPQDQVRLSKVDPQKPGAAAADAARGDDAVARERALKEAQSRISDLEKNVADMRRLLELKDQQLAELQKKAGEKPAPAAPAPAPAAKAPEKPAPAPAPVAKAPEKPAAEAPKPAPAPAAPAPAAPAPAAKAPEPPKPAAEAPKPAAPAPKPAAPAPKPAAKAPTPEPSLLDEFLENPAALGGLVLVVVLLVGYGVWAWRKKKAAQAKFQDSVMGAATAGAAAASIAEPTLGAATPPSTAPSTATAPPPGMAAEEVDPIAEADVYMAYGRDAQAEEILKEALQKDSNRAPVHAKLLEIYAKRKDPKAFEQTALKLKGITNGAGPEWEKAAALGYSIDPGNGLYAGAAPAAAAAAPEAPAAAPAAAAPTLDFDIGGAAQASASAPDLTLDAEPKAADAGLDFDVSGATQTQKKDISADETIVAPSEEKSASGLDFNLDLGAAPEPKPAPAPAAAAPAADAGLSFDLNLDLGGDQKAEAPAAAAPAPDLSSISLDLGTPDAGAAAAPTGTDPKWQEIATKLDLAKAYEEMGDKNGARELLNEVMKDGDAAQKGTAQQLLAKLG